MSDEKDERDLPSSYHSSLITLGSPLHVEVAAEVFEDAEAEALVEAAGVGVEHEDHVAEALARGARLLDERADDGGAEAAALRLREQRDVEQAYLLLGAADPDAPDRAAFQLDHVVLGFGEARVVLLLLRVVLRAAEGELLLVVPPGHLRQLGRARAGVDPHQLFVVRLPRRAQGGP